MRRVVVVTVWLVGALAARGAIAVFENIGESAPRSTAISGLSGPDLHPKAAVEPTWSPDVALGDGKYGATGTGETVSFTVALAVGEAVVGQSYGFNGQTTGCRVWLIAGPFLGSATVTDGEYFVFGGTQLTASQDKSLMNLVAQKQAAQGYGCSTANQQIDWLGGESAS